MTSRGTQAASEYLKNGASAIITVRVYPTGEPGFVALSIAVDGRANLTGTEAAVLLRKAADEIDGRDADLVV